MWRDWDVTTAIRLLIQHAFVYLTEKLEFMSIQKVASRHHLGTGRHSRNEKASFRKIRAFIEIVILDEPNSTGSYKGTG